MLYRAQAVIGRDPGGAVEDVAVNTFTFEADSDASTAEYIANKVADLYRGTNSIMALLSTSHWLDRVKVYNAEAEGASLFNLDLNVRGGMSGAIVPLQVACSVTFKVTNRKRWGRVYIPGMVTQNLEPLTGLWTVGAITYLADRFASWSDALDTPTVHNLQHVTTSRNEDDPGKPLSPVIAYQVDNVPDVIRSRRAQSGILRQHRNTLD